MSFRHELTDKKVAICIIKAAIIHWWIAGILMDGQTCPGYYISSTTYCSKALQLFIDIHFNYVIQLPLHNEKPAIMLNNQLKFRKSHLCDSFKRSKKRIWWWLETYIYKIDVFAIREGKWMPSELIWYRVKWWKIICKFFFCHFFKWIMYDRWTNPI